MLKQKKCGSKNGGYTMVEVMTALVIVTILMTVLGYIFLSSMNYFTFFGSKRNVKIMVDSMLDYGKENLSMATNIYITDKKLVDESGNETVPSGWDEEATDYICFHSLTQKGIVSTKRVDAYFSEDTYEGGSLECSVSFDNEVESESTPSADGQKKNLNLSLHYYDAEGELKYTRERTIDIVNMTKFQRKISGECAGISLAEKTPVTNAEAAIYIYYTKEPLTVEDDHKESLIWQQFQQIYAQNVESNPDYYLNDFPLKTQIPTQKDETGAVGTVTSRIGPADNRHGILMWQYRASYLKAFDGQDWGNCNNRTKVEYLLPIDEERKEKLKAAGITTLNGLSLDTTNFYMVPFHFVENTDTLDLLYYVYNSTYFDNKIVNRTTQLIYNQEENAWYYLPIGDGQKCTRLYKETYTYGAGYNAFPIDFGVNPMIDSNKTVDDSCGITYLLADGSRYTMKITSSFQIKLFFKKYGIKLDNL